MKLRAIGDSVVCDETAYASGLKKLKANCPRCHIDSFAYVGDNGDITTMMTCDHFNDFRAVGDTYVARFTK
jgi:hypothetical protein